MESGLSYLLNLHLDSVIAKYPYICLDRHDDVGFAKDTGVDFATDRGSDVDFQLLGIDEVLPPHDFAGFKLDEDEGFFPVFVQLSVHNDLDIHICFLILCCYSRHHRARKAFHDSGFDRRTEERCW